MANTNHDLVEHLDVGREAEAHAQTPLIAPQAQMVLLTWVTFFILLAVLKKFAWGPILAALDKREKHIEEAVSNADHIKVEMAKLEETIQETLNKAETKARAMLEEARQAAKEASRNIEHKAKEEAKIIVENARREIAEEVSRTKSQLRKESAEIAITLAGKLIEENLDNEKNHKLLQELVQKI